MQERTIDRRYERIQEDLRFKLENNPYLGNRREGFKSGIRCAMSKLHEVYGDRIIPAKDSKADRYRYVQESLSAKVKKNPRKPMDEGFNEGLKWAMKEIEKVYGGDADEA